MQGAAICRDFTRHISSRSAALRALTGVSALAICAGLTGVEPASAQAQSGGGGVETVVVTGSLVQRNGYQAPTPLTVLGAADLQQGSTANVADYLNTVPAFTGSQTPANTHGISAGTNGVNALNLRDLGLPRTLVLLDGQRSVGSLVTGAVDISDFPQQLIQRVDVVTGGASAVYGSDAVAGVVNFILDKDFTGFKADISGGITDYGDDKQFDVKTTGGFVFAGGRGHVLLSAEESDKAGIPNSNRPWNALGWGTINNPNYTATNGQPALLVLKGVGEATATHGGIVTSGPLKGTAFGPGGSVYQFHYGSLVSGNLMYGGDWKAAEVRLTNGPALDTADSRQNLFTRVAYDVTDNINVYAQGSWSRSRSVQLSTPVFYRGSFPVIKAGNPFIPASVQTAMTANHLTTLQLGSMSYDLPDWGADNERVVTRGVLGASGKFGFIGTDWNWNVYFQNGFSISSVDAEPVVQKSRVVLASDAVANPAVGGVAGVGVGQPVCRSTLTDPTNGCIPYNPFGTGVNGPATVKYLMGPTGGHSLLHETLTENVLAGTLSGNPISIWAGPVSVAMNIVHRKESAHGSADATSLALDWFGGNATPVIGSYSVTEGALETVIPLANGVWWADNWDLNAAIRYTDYSTSGFVTTWKLGTTYAPVPDIKFRATQSRDIRAPNLQELYANLSASSQSSVTDYLTNPVSMPTVYGLSSGNPNLTPEVATNTTVGVVLAPRFLPGFSGSVDYWFVKIKNGIEPIGGQTAINLCFQGNTAFCSYIVRNSLGVATGVKSIPTNLAEQRANGIDFDATYKMSASDFVSDWDGDLSLHALATKYIENLTNSGLPGSIPIETVGNNYSGNGSGNPPNWRVTATLSYTNDAMTATLTGRAVSAGVYDDSYVQCTSGCPASSVNHMTINDNHIAGAFYLDGSYTYRFGSTIFGVDTNDEAYLSVSNLLGANPVVVAPGATGNPFFSNLTNPSIYDFLGRVFRAGIRINTN